MDWNHVSVLKDEALEYLAINPNGRYIDATLGLGGHTAAIAEQLESGEVIGIDADRDALSQAQARLESQTDRVRFVHANFAQLREVVEERNLESVAGILADLGVSSMELDNPERGFSFQQEGELDMRFDRETQTLTARDIVNTYREQDLVDIFREYGDEKFPGRIARIICEQRKKQEIQTTTQLAELIRSVVPGRFKDGRIHPATRVFQALRIEVNDELNVLRQFLRDAVEVLDKDGRLVVISFHSGEDRIVKNIFRELASAGHGDILTKKPIIPTEQEIAENPRSRSAKMRVFCKHQ